MILLNVGAGTRIQMGFFFASVTLTSGCMDEKGNETSCKQQNHHYPRPHHFQCSRSQDWQQTHHYKLPTRTAIWPQNVVFSIILPICQYLSLFSPCLASDKQWPWMQMAIWVLKPRTEVQFGFPGQTMWTHHSVQSHWSTQEFVLPYFWLSTFAESSQLQWAFAVVNEGWGKNRCWQKHQCN